VQVEHELLSSQRDPAVDLLIGGRAPWTLQPRFDAPPHLIGGPRHPAGSRCDVGEQLVRIGETEAPGNCILVVEQQLVAASPRRRVKSNARRKQRFDRLFEARIFAEWRKRRSREGGRVKA
jgi:hypothetical protein